MEATGDFSVMTKPIYEMTLEELKDTEDSLLSMRSELGLTAKQNRQLASIRHRIQAIQKEKAIQ